MGGRLYLRLLSVALLVLFLPIAGVATLASLEKELLAAEERAMAAQATTLASSLALAGGDLSAGTAHELLRGLARPLTGRVRILAVDRTALADTASPLRAESVGDEADQVRNRALYRVGSFLWRALEPLRRRDGERLDYGAGDGPAIERALAGEYGALTRLSADGSATVLTVAVPLRAGSAVAGAVVISRTTDTVLAALTRVRFDLFRVIVLSVLATALIAWLLARGLVTPLLRLRDAADRALRPHDAGAVEFPETHRRDEIGELARALQALQGRLDRRVGELEAFASDVAHEVRNPLAAIRSAADLLPASTSEDERARLLVLIGGEVRRVDEVVSALQELARIDAGGRTEGTARTDLAALVESVADAFRERDAGAHRIVVTHPHQAAIAAPAEAAARVVENLLQNALSFSPAGGAVRLTVTPHPEGVELVIADDGPGVPAEHRERVFERFFSWRPAGGAGRHLGLGLAVARALAEHHGGSIRLDAPVEGGGASFRVRWPGARL